MTVKSTLLTKDADPALHILRKLATKEPNTSPLFNALLSSQLHSRLSKRETMVIASEMTLSRFRQHGSLKDMFANRDDFTNSFLLQLIRTTAFPAEDLRQFFDTVLHAQGLDAYALSAKQQYQQARAQLESVLMTLTPQKGQSSLAQAGQAQIALTTTLSTIKTAKAKLARSFSSIPKDFVFLLLPLYRQWVKTVGNAPKAKRSFLNAISWALIERQISSLVLPKEAKTKRIQALRTYLKTSGMLDKIWLALKLANLSFGQQAPNKGTLNHVATIYHECEALFTEFKLLQSRVQNTIDLCQRLAKELYAKDPGHARILVQHTVNIHSQYIACTKYMGSSILTLSQAQRKIDNIHGSMDEIMSAILMHKSNNYSRKFLQGMTDFAQRIIQKRWIEALRCLFIAPLRDAKELAVLSKNQILVQDLTAQDATLQAREMPSQQSQSDTGNTSNVVNLFDRAVVLETQFSQSKKTIAKDQDNQQSKEAAVFAPKFKT